MSCLNGLSGDFSSFDGIQNVIVRVGTPVVNVRLDYWPINIKLPSNTSNM